MTQRRALVCSPLPPEFDRESGSRRIFHLIEFLQEAGWAVTVLVQNDAPGLRHMRLLRQRGVAAFGDGDRRLEHLLSNGGFDLAIVAFWHLAASYLSIIRTRSPSTKIVVDSIDVHFLRQARALLRSRCASRPSVLDDDLGRALVGELNVYAAADAVLTVSEKESDLLNDFLSSDGRAHAHSVPLCEDLTPLSESFENRSGILFLGNFRHPPNVDAVGYLAHSIVPRLDRHLLDQHPIFIVGNGMTEAVSRVAETIPNVRIVGWVPSVVPYFARARVTVAPLRYGAGTKRKLIESLMLGTPCVSSTMGAEGLGVESGRHLLVADEPDAFAEATRKLLCDATLWHELSNRGHAAIAKIHGRASVKERFLGLLETMLAAPR